MSGGPEMKHPSLSSARKARQFLTSKLVSAVQAGPTSKMATAAVLRGSEEVRQESRKGQGQGSSSYSSTPSSPPLLSYSQDCFQSCSPATSKGCHQPSCASPNNLQVCYQPCPRHTNQTCQSGSQPGLLPAPLHIIPLHLSSTPPK